MKAQDNRESFVSVNPNMGIAVTIVRDFIRKILMDFHGSKFEEDPQEFIDHVYKVFMIMWVTSLANV